MNDIQVISRPAIPAETALPEELLRLLEAEGLRPSWQRNTAEMLSTYHGKGMKPVTRKTLDDLTFKDVDGLFFTPEGYIAKFDCILMVQPMERWSETEAVFARITAQREGSEEHLNALDEQVKELMARAGAQVARAGGDAKGIGSVGIDRERAVVPPAGAHIAVSKQPG